MDIFPKLVEHAASTTSVIHAKDPAKSPKKLTLAFTAAIAMVAAVGCSGAHREEHVLTEANAAAITAEAGSQESLAENISTEIEEFEVRRAVLVGQDKALTDALDDLQKLLGKIAVKKMQLGNLNGAQVTLVNINKNLKKFINGTMSIDHEILLLKRATADIKVRLLNSGTESRIDDFTAADLQNRKALKRAPNVAKAVAALINLNPTINATERDARIKTLIEKATHLVALEASLPVDQSSADIIARAAQDWQKLLSRIFKGSVVSFADFSNMFDRPTDPPERE